MDILDFHRRLQSTNLNPVTLKNVHQPMKAPRISGRRKNESSHVAFASRPEGGDEELTEVTQARRAVLRRRLQGRQAGGHVHGD